MSVSHRLAQTTNPLDSYVRGQKRRGWGDKNKCIRLVRESPCNDVMGYRLARVHNAKPHLKIWQFNVSVLAGKSARQSQYELKDFITHEDLYNSASMPSSISASYNKHT